MRLVGPFRKIAHMSKRDHGVGPNPGAIHFDVPYIHQNHINLCGDASTNMLLMYHRMPAMSDIKPSDKYANVYKMRKNPRGVVEGADTNDLGAVPCLYSTFLVEKSRWWASPLRHILSLFARQYLDESLSVGDRPYPAITSRRRTGNCTRMT